jgi:hypothetical protein
VIAVARDDVAAGHATACRRSRCELRRRSRTLGAAAGEWTILARQRHLSTGCGGILTGNRAMIDVEQAAVIAVAFGLRIG